MMRHSAFGPVLGAGFLVAGLGFASPAQATCSDDTYMGAVCFTTSYYCPKNTAEAGGQLLAISQYTALYSLLGTAFGGDGRTSFALPDLRGRSVAGVGAGPGLTPVARGQKYGAENVTLTLTELPEHSHTQNLPDMAFSGTAKVKATTATGTELAPGGHVPASRPASGPVGKRQPLYVTGMPNTIMASDVLQVTLPTDAQTLSAGADAAMIQPLYLRPPQATMLACVVINGPYPPRPSH